MKTGKVIGSVWATRKDDNLTGIKLMVIQPINILDDSYTGYPVVAADFIGAGIGEKVIYVSGSSARVAAGGQHMPVDMTVIGIIDEKEVLE